MNTHQINSSFTSSLLAQEEAFRFAKTESTLGAAANLTTATFISASTALAATIETAISLLADVLTSPAYFIVPERYAHLTQHTVDSAQTALEATKRIFGQGTVVEPKPPTPVVELTRIERLSQFLRMQGTKTFQILHTQGVNALQFGKDHKRSIALAAATLGAVAAIIYFFGPRLIGQTAKVISNPVEQMPHIPTQNIVNETVSVPNNFNSPNTELPVKFENTTCPAPALFQEKKVEAFSFGKKDFSEPSPLTPFLTNSSQPSSHTQSASVILGGGIVPYHKTMAAVISGAAAVFLGVHWAHSVSSALSTWG